MLQEKFASFQKYCADIEEKLQQAKETITKLNFELHKKVAFMRKYKREQVIPKKQKTNYHNTCRYCKEENSCRNHNGSCKKDACQAIRNSEKQQTYNQCHKKLKK